MKFKLDENIAGVKRTLERLDSDFDVETVQSEKIRGTSDKKLLEILSKEERILITVDRDFENLALYPPKSHSGILILRSNRQGKLVIGKLIVDFFQTWKKLNYDINQLFKERIAVSRFDRNEVFIESLE